jgi:hypothetical protein
MKSAPFVCTLMLLAGCTSVAGTTPGLESHAMTAVRTSSAAMVNPGTAAELATPDTPARAPQPERRADRSKPALPASDASQVVDASARAVPADLLAEAVVAFSAHTDDTYALQLRHLRVFKMADGAYDSICGEFSAKDKSGKYAGFRPFQYLPPFRQVALSSVSCQNLKNDPLPEIRDTAQSDVSMSRLGAPATLAAKSIATPPVLTP